MEPWSVVKCSVCKEKYHVADGSKCKCGKKESKERLESIGGYYEFKKA